MLGEAAEGSAVVAAAALAVEGAFMRWDLEC
jgi:hypothetical protein